MNKLALWILAASLAAAQTTPPQMKTKLPEERPSRTVYEFKNVDIDRAVEIVNFLRQLDPQVLIQVNGPFKTAILQPNGNVPAGTVEHAIELLKRYDVPPPPTPSVEFVAYLVWASAHYGSAPGEPLPPAIQEAVAEMKKTFAYTDYRLLDTASTEVRHNAEIENMLPFAAGAGGRFFYVITYGDTFVAPDGKSVTINHFKFSLRIPTGGGYESSGITTDVAIREGEKLVIGKVRTGLGTPVDLFLILTVKLH